MEKTDLSQNTQTKIAAVFPGQGSQYVGMGRDMYDNFELAREIFHRAEKILGYDIAELCFNGPAEKLAETRYTQPAIFLISYIAFRLLQQYGLQFDRAAGHSLGEYTALAAAGAVSFEEALKLVNVRGKLMYEIVFPGKGSPMAALIGCTQDKLEEIFNRKDTAGRKVWISIYNCPGQYVISGEPEDVEYLSGIVISETGSKVVPLTVSGPFHCPLYRTVSDKLKIELEKVKFRKAAIPVVTNVSADYVQDPGNTVTSLYNQMTRPVLWEKSVKRLISDGTKIFIECGPKKVLRGLIRKTDSTVKVFNVESKADIERLIESLKAINSLEKEIDHGSA